MPKERISGGLFAELPTPFEEDGTVDWFGFGRVLEGCLTVGCGGYLLCGRTAEGDTLSLKERRALVEDASLAAGNRAEVILCVSAEKGIRAVEEACLGEEAGATALFLETREETGAAGVLRAVNRIRGECPLPIIIECRQNLNSLGIYGEFAEKGKVLAVAQRREGLWDHLLLRDALDEREVGTAILCEEQFSLFPVMRYAGVLSKLICCHPRAALELWKGRGNARGWDIHRKARALLSLFRGENSIPALKWAMHRQGICAPTVRLPLCEPEISLKNAVERALEKL